MEFIGSLLATVVNFFKAIWDAFQRLFDWLNDAYDAFIDFFKQLPAWIFENLVDDFVSFFNKIPVPDFFATAANAFGNIPESVVYFAQPFHIGTGVTMVLGAYFLRFIIRRIPLFG
ncbi:MAG: DUF2523 family protein [Pseudomonas sp.]|nr:DUF2523 family protein [Pseudomonas sp.]